MGVPNNVLGDALGEAEEGMSKGYDSKCYDLAEAFVDDTNRCDGTHYTPADIDELAQEIQGAIESWFSGKQSERELSARRIANLEKAVG